MSEPLAEILDAINGLRADLAAFRAEFSRAPQPLTGDEITWSHGRRPQFWPDIAVRADVIALHRQVIIDEAFRRLVEKFGPERAPSKSAIGRTWQAIDQHKRRRA